MIPIEEARKEIIERWMSKANMGQYPYEDCADEAMQEYAELWHSQQPGISAERAQYLLNIRDALVHSDVNEAYHWLSKFYNPALDKYSDEVWKDMEELAATEDHEKYIPDSKLPSPSKPEEPSQQLMYSEEDMIEFADWIKDWNSPKEIQVWYDNEYKTLELLKEYKSQNK